MDIRIKEENVLNKNFSIIKIKNSKGMKMTLFSLGASLYSLKILNKKNEEIETLIAPKSLEAFIHKDQYFGKTIGRVAGRIDKGVLNFENKSYVLEKNWNGISCLHGGEFGLSNKNFDFEINRCENYCEIIFKSYILQKEDHMPGNLDVTVIYKIYENENSFDIKFIYKCSKKSIASFTNHACFNLNGKGNVLEDELYINASSYGHLNNELISTKIAFVNEIMDFREGKKIGEFINDEYLKNHTAFGYDHPFILDTKNLKDICKNADILVAAIGKAKFVTTDMVKDGAVVIDVGINRIDGKLYGDVDYDQVVNKASYITPVPGGVGPMTIAMLLKNTYLLA